MKRNLIIVLIIITTTFLSLKIISCQSSEGKGEIEIEWSDDLKGDFSFQKLWSYPESVFRNSYGQLSCDGLCLEEVEHMMDSTGRIYSDSLEVFYQIVDTTHQFHTIESEASCYEWAGTDFMTVKKLSEDSLRCYSLTNSSTHCSLVIEIINGQCYPKVELNSISSPNIETFRCLGGFMKVDKRSWEKGILKADFNLDFKNPDKQDQPFFWKGKICAKIS